MISRTLVSIPVSLIVSLFLFYALALITHMENTQPDSRQIKPNLDFSMHIQESEIAVRERRLPEEPENTPQLPPLVPQINVNVAPVVDTPPPAIEIPKIDAGVKLSASLTDLPLPAPSLKTARISTPAAVMSIETNPTVTSRVLPRYPRRAQLRGQEGRVVVEFVVTESGRVKSGSMKIIESTPRGVFDKAVLRALKHWRFKVRIENGQPVAYRASQELGFTLNE